MCRVLSSDGQEEDNQDKELNRFDVRSALSPIAVQHARAFESSRTKQSKPEIGLQALEASGAPAFGVASNSSWKVPSPGFVGLHT